VCRQKLYINVLEKDLKSIKLLFGWQNALIMMFSVADPAEIQCSINYITTVTATK